MFICFYGINLLCSIFLQAVKMNFSEDEKIILITNGRFIIYWGLVLAFIFGIYGLAKIYGADTFEENGVIENIQLAFLIISCVSFLILIGSNVSFRTVLLLLASCCLLATCRELDKVLDKIVPIVHWKFGWLFPAAAFYYAVKHFEQTKKALLKFFTFPAFYLMYLAMIIMLLAECVGHKPFVQAVLGNNHVAAIKEFYEEATETVCYFMILLSTIEMRFNLRLLRRENSNISLSEVRFEREK